MTIGGLVGGANILDQLVGNVDPQTTIAQINGENISPDRFNNIVNQQIENSRASGKKVNDLEIHRARNNAWDNLVQDVLVSQEVKRLKISSTDDEVMYHLENNPPPFLQQNPSFQTDGSFDMIKYREALSNPQGNEWVPIEAFMKNTFIPNYKLQRMLDESIIITEKEIKEEFIKRNTEYTASGIHVTSARVPVEESEPTEDEILNEYEQNKSNYSHKELRSVSYVSWKKSASKEDSTATNELALELLKRARSGEDFAIIANEYSMDPGNQGAKGGDLGWFKKGRMVKSFDEAAFSSKTGSIIGPISSSFGYHVINVRDKRKNKDGEDEILGSHILLKVDMGPTTLSNIKRDATLFSYDAQDNGFEKAVSEHGLITSEHIKMDNTGFTIKGLGGLRSAIRFAFNSKVNDISSILENDQYFAILKLDSITPPGTRSLAEVESQIKNILKKVKVNAGTLEDANKILINLSSNDLSIEELVESDKDIDGFKKETKTLYQGFQSIGRSNYVTGALLGADPGSLLGPLETRLGHVIIQVIDIANFDSTEYLTQRDLLQQTVFNRKQGLHFQAWIDDLKDNAEIVDNREYYY
jgi:parvulin-like peptidyl-prolyl isomerase